MELCPFVTFSMHCRVASRVRDCGIPAYFAALASYFKLCAYTVTLNAENWRILVRSVRIWVSLISGEFRRFPIIPPVSSGENFRD